MNTVARYVILVLVILISLHFILSFSHPTYGRVTSFDNVKSHLGSTFGGLGDYSNLESHEKVEQSDSLRVNTKRANATFIMLARNSDTDGAVRSIRQMEERFNRKYNYPYIFLNEEPFSEDFKKRISVLTDAKVEFGLIPHDHWYQPDWIDEEKAKKGREQMVNDKVIYGGSVSYRNMCRYNSGFFFKHELTLKYRWYWRIEPDVHFHCDVTYDPFLYLEDHNKTYGFTITMYEYVKTIPTLWGHVKDFMGQHPEWVPHDNAMGYMSDNGGQDYNLCHFWSNFEIADMDFWRGEMYQEFFKYLDTKGGFYYERWGDAPVHSLAVALMGSKHKIHLFEDMGYEHNPYTHCPKKEEDWKKGHCSCNPSRNFDYDGYSCMKQWERIW